MERFAQAETTPGVLAGDDGRRLVRVRAEERADRHAVLSGDDGGRVPVLRSVRSIHHRLLLVDFFFPLDAATAMTPTSATAPTAPATMAPVLSPGFAGDVTTCCDGVVLPPPLG